jgi:hypothetical protein
MSPEYHRLIMLFVDGVGLAAGSRDNPLGWGLTPTLDRLTGGGLTLERTHRRTGSILVPLDAGLGVPGLPQSATGQTALLSGANGAQRLGRHVTGLPGPQLRRMIREASVFRRLQRENLSATFANAYSESYLEALAQGRKRPSATTCAVSAAGLELRRVEHLLRGEAVSWDICRDRFGAGGTGALETISAFQAGRHLVKLADRHRFTLFETFLTDLAGHGRLGVGAEEALKRLDGLVAGALSGLSSRATLLLTSDHGNLEESEHRRHTANPVPLLVVGPLATRFADLGSILEVTPAVVEALR